MSERRRLVIVGGVAAGMSAAAKVRRTDPDVDVVVLERGGYVSYGACGLPWLICGRVPAADGLSGSPTDAGASLCGEMPDETKLFARTPEQFMAMGVDLRIRHEVLSFDPDRQQVRVKNLDTNAEVDEPYDVLLIATGASAIWPDIPGIDLKGIFRLRTMEDGLSLRDYVEIERPKRAVIVGGGYIGLEMLDCFKCMAVETVVVDIAPRILMRSLDEDVVQIVSEELARSGIRLSVSDGLEAFEGTGRVSGVVTQHNQFPADIVIMALGVRPNVELARTAGVVIGETGAIAVDKHMRTSVPNVYAAGDCAEAHHLVTGRPAYVPLGSTANKQGRTAGAYIGGRDAAFDGIVGTAVSKVLGLQVARTGLTEEQAETIGLQAAGTMIESWSTAHYYPGGSQLWVKLVYEPDSLRLLGGQIVGEQGAAKRIDVLATALHQGMTVEDIRALDLSYAPPYSPVWDPVLVAANVAVKD